MHKPYAWEEIREFLVKELNKTKHIMTFGTIGSHNVNNDIDTIITKEPKSKSSDFYKEIHKVFDELNNYLNKRYRARAICISADEKTLKHVIKFRKNDLFFDLMVYTSYPQIENDWKWAMFYEDKIEDILFKGYSLLKGENSSLRNKEFIKKNYADSIFIYLYHGDMIHSHTPNKLFLKCMNYLFDFLYRKRLKLKSPVAKNEKQVREYFYRLCDILDKLNKRKRIRR